MEAKAYYFSEDDKRVLANALMAYKEELHRCIMETTNQEEREYYKAEVYESDMIGNFLDLDGDYFQMEE